jgi:hypothetical protein
VGISIVKKLSKTCHRFVFCARAFTIVSVPNPLRHAAALLVVIACACAAFAARKDSPQETYGQGLSVRVEASHHDLLQAVQDVAGNGIIQGTKEYNKDEYIAGAETADRSDLFPQWGGAGEVFYKIKKNALDPRNFKDTNDTGTLAVRYIVQSQDEQHTILKIDAAFEDDLHRRLHLSNGSVESAEYKDIQEHLEAMHLRAQQASPEQKDRELKLAERELERRQKEKQLQLEVAQAPDETVDQHVSRLRRDVERIVKSPGAQLKSAPFHSASSTTQLPPGTRVVILILTAYWCGVETETGEHGWIHHSQLEQLP